MGLERREPLADVDGRPQFAIDAIDPRVESPDLGGELGPKRVDLCREACIHAVDFLIESDEPLIEDTDVSPERVNLGSDDVLKCLLDLIVHAHGLIQSGQPAAVNVAAEIRRLAEEL